METSQGQLTQGENNSFQQTAAAFGTPLPDLAPVVEDEMDRIPPDFSLCEKHRVSFYCNFSLGGAVHAQDQPPGRF